VTATKHQVPRVSRIRAICLLLGVLASALTVLYLDRTLPQPAQIEIQGSRQTGFEEATYVLDHGGPPLTGANIQLHFAKSAFSTRAEIAALKDNVLAVGLGDDQGMYVYVPWLGHVLDITDPRVVLRGIYLSLAAIAALLYPLLFYEIFASMLVGALAPFGLLLILRAGVPLVDVYWAPALILLLGIPILFSLRGKRVGSVIAGIFALAVLASLSDSIRADSGVGLFIVLIIILFRWLHGWRSRLVAGIVMFVGFLSIYPIAIDGVRAYRNSRLSVTQQGTLTAASHTFWHPTYLGLGYIPNNFGITYNDAVGIETAIAYDPRVVYLSSAYNIDLEHAYARIVVSDPGFVLEDFAEKTGDIMGGAVRRFWPGLLLLVSASLIGPKRRLIRRILLLSMPVLALVAAPPILVMPVSVYEEPWFAMVGLIATFGIGAVVVSVQDYLTMAGRGDSGLFETSLHAAKSSLHPRRVRFTWRRIGAVCLLLSVLVAAYELEQASQAWDQRTAYGAASSPTTLLSQIGIVRATASWDFAAPCCQNWTVFQGTDLSVHRNSTVIQTGLDAFGYQMQSRKFETNPGHYSLILRGDVQAGGISIGVLDTSSNTWVGAPGNFWSGESQGSGFGMVVNVTVARTTPVEVILSNWRPNGGQSVWRLFSMELARVSR